MIRTQMPLTYRFEGDTWVIEQVSNFGLIAKAKEIAKVYDEDDAKYLVWAANNYDRLIENRYMLISVLKQVREMFHVQSPTAEMITEAIGIAVIGERKEVRP